MDFHDEPILDLATCTMPKYSNDQWWLATASEDHCVRLFSAKPRSETGIRPTEGGRISEFSDKSSMNIDMPLVEFNRLLTRMSLNIRSICFSSDGKWLAVAGEELSIKMLDMNQVELEKESDPVPVSLLRGHSYAVRSVCFTSDNLLLSVSMEGSAKIWNLNEDRIEWECLRTLNDMPGRIDLE